MGIIKTNSTVATSSSVISEVYQQNVIGQTTDTIVVTENGGILPLNDDRIVLSGPTGILQQGQPDGYTINRAATPNELILANTPLGPMDLVLVFYV